MGKAGLSSSPSNDTVLYHTLGSLGVCFTIPEVFPLLFLETNIAVPSEADREKIVKT